MQQQGKATRNASHSPSAQAALDVSVVRRKFPALRQRVKGKRPVYFDNPGGTQVPSEVISAMRQYLVGANSNTHGVFHTSQQTDRIVDEARLAMADKLNADSPDEIVFGSNMTTLTMHISRSIGRTLNKGDEIIVTRMDHDANIAPWLLVARDHDLIIRWVDFDPETGRLDLEQMGALITHKTKLVACVYASNALGTINDVARVTRMAHAVGAWTYIDAVQYAPHGSMDVQALDCDFLVCSAYKFFGPHVGILYGKREHLASLPAYKVRPASDEVPERWETGTQNHEGLAGVKATVDYLAWLGERFGRPFETQVGGDKGRRGLVKLAMAAIQDYEHRLTKHLLEGLATIQGVRVFGITDLESLDERVPTIVFTVEVQPPREVARKLGEAGLYVWDGNYYALAVMERLGCQEKGGMVRVGVVHYNTQREIEDFLGELEGIARG